MRHYPCARLLAALGASLAFGSAIADGPQGTYKPAKDPTGVSWQINAHGALVWNNIPYLPLGVTVDPTAASINAAKAAGITDVLVDLPASGEGWSAAIDSLEAAHLHYLVRIGSLTPMARGIAVDPAAYRIDNTGGSHHIDVPMPDATEALVVVAQKRDGSVEQWKRVPVTDGRLVYDVKLKIALETVVLIYPRTVSLAQPDYWEELDAHRDQLLEAMRQHPFGPGLRGIVNPMGKTLTLPGQSPRFVPTSLAFRSEFARFLEERYRNVVSVLRSWSMGSEIIAVTETGEDKGSVLSFEDVSQFVPLWSGSRGLSQFWDPVHGKLYTSDSNHSTYWKDLSEAINAAESRRYQRMVSAIRSVDDVPVIQEWAGWAAPSEVSGQDPTVDGIGMRARGTSPSEIIETASKATSSLLRWPSTKPGWLPATDIDLNTSDASKQLSGVLDDLTSLGARGIFIHSLDAAELKAIAAEAVRRSTDTTIAGYSPKPLFFPENATNPAEAQRLPGGFWWLPSPADGDRIDFGGGFNGYRIADKTGNRIVIWADKPQRTLLHMASTKKVEVAAVDGSNPDPKSVKNGLQVDISETPLVVMGTEEIPIPDPSFQASSAEIADLLKKGEEQHRDFTAATLELGDALQGFDRNPGGEFPKIRSYLHQLDAALGDYTWVEGEASPDTNFSEIAKEGGCSQGSVLELHSQIDTPDGFFANYELPMRSKGDQELWVAARKSDDPKQTINLKISGQTFQLAGNPVGLYGNGYGWYHLGTTRSLGDAARLQLTVGGTGDDFSVDAILLAPASFRPNGVAPPESRPSVSTPKKAPRGKGRKQQPTPEPAGPVTQP